MHSYFPTNLSEEALKSRVAKEFFAEFSCEPFGKIDFCINYRNATLFESLQFLWAEAKAGDKSDIYESFVQLILTIGKADLYENLLPPAFLGAFDCAKIAFVEYHEIMSVFSQSDFNWNVAPSDYTTKEFRELYAKIKHLLESKSLVFDYSKDKTELKNFIAQNFTLSNKNLSKIPITKNNFIRIYIKWLTCVKPSISIDWETEKPEILDSDFYLADLLSYQNTTKEIFENLRILLDKDHYRIALEKLRSGRLNISEVFFKDAQKAHSKFWNLYERPPKEEFWGYIIERRDLLVPQDIRERKGAFFTPSIWVEKAQDYLANALGEDWQEEYYIWDCAAGTGNLLANLSNKYHIFASTLDKSDVEIIKERIKNGANLCEEHIFAFDFLNDELFDKIDEKGNILAQSKLPKSLQEILRDESKRQRLVIFINPPYAEAGSRKQATKTGTTKERVARDNKISEIYKKELGKANNELFAQFFIRIYKEIPNCILASFSTLKYVNSTNFIKFRESFQAKFLKGFMCPADSFDNVKGQFPIGFLIWDLAQKTPIKQVKLDTFESSNKIICKKRFYASKKESINKWLAKFFSDKDEQIGVLMADAPDFQNNNHIAFINEIGIAHLLYKKIIPQNLIPFCVYFAVRLSIKSSWINNRDQFISPSNEWQQDSEFKNDCLAFALFHTQNKITSKDSINHFIPFGEKEVNAKSSFTSHFMNDFINGKIKPESEIKQKECFKDLCVEKQSFIPTKPLDFSPQAQEVLRVGHKLWRYYHEVASDKSSPQSLANPYSPYNANASLYDIKEFFKGRNEKNTLNLKSKDEHFNSLIAQLNQALQNLAKKLESKIYEYGFLEE